VVGETRQRHDPNAALGVPAHVTLLYPFRPLERIDEGVLATLEALFAATPAFELTFARVGRFKGARWLAPEPRRGVDELTRRLTQAFPDCPPYEGAHGHPVPHLTFAIGHDEEELDFAALAVKERLTAPIRSRVSAACLYALEETGWREQARFALGLSATI
jgi:2'-5' RNA ligase